MYDGTAFHSSRDLKCTNSRNRIVTCICLLVWMWTMWRGFFYWNVFKIMSKSILFYVSILFHYFYNAFFIFFNSFTYLFYFIISFYYMTMFLCEALWVFLVYEKCFLNKVALPLLLTTASECFVFCLFTSDTKCSNPAFTCQKPHWLFRSTPFIGWLTRYGRL